MPDFGYLLTEFLSNDTLTLVVILYGLPANGRNGQKDRRPMERKTENDNNKKEWQCCIVISSNYTIYLFNENPPE